jgi:3-methyladenine DNA glycosylase Tag
MQTDDSRLSVASVHDPWILVHGARETHESKEHGSFSAWLDAHHPRPPDEWRKLFKRTFVFTGGEIVSSFLLSTGYLPGAHEESCPVFRKVLKARPAWTREGKRVRG